MTDSFDRRLLLSAAGLAGVAALARSSKAGPLNPPSGPVSSTPGPEPRIAINATNTPGDATSIYRITQPGSYYLTGNVAGAASKSGIKVAASNVTIDLCGFTLTGGTGSQDGIQGSSGLSNVSVSNGTITGWQSWGIDMDTVAGCRIRDVTCENNLDGGIRVDTRSNVEFCVCSGNDGEGIRIGGAGVVSHCVCTANTQNGIYIVGGTQGGGVVECCACNSNSLAGVRVGSFCIVSDCTCNLNGNVGIGLASNCRVVGNTCNSNLADGVQCSAGNNSRIEDNNANNNTQRGIFVGGTRNFIVRNTASNNGAGGAGDFSFSAPNVYGEINNFAAGAALTANPWTNIKY